MAAPIVPSTLTCTQCGAELHPDEGQVFLTCPSCGSTVYLDPARVVLHWYVAPTLDEEKAGAALRRWMSGSSTVKDLDRKAQIGAPSFTYFPLWSIKQPDGSGEQERIRPAAATSISELSQLRLPAGDLRRYDSALDAQSTPPSVPLEAALRWSKVTVPSLPKDAPAQPEAERHEAERRFASLVHVPLYTFPYSFGGQQYTAVVDAASGGVLANRYPAKSESPFVVVALVTALVYLCLGLLPVLALLGAFGQDGFTLGLVACAAGGALAAVPLFLWAFRVASKV